jgi:hypothetical protein
MTLPILGGLFQVYRWALRILKETLIIHKTCEVYSLWFFEELLKLIGISHGIHLDLSNGVSHHRLWRLPYTEVLVCHKQRVEVFHSNLSIERSWVPFRCWVSLFLTGFTSVTLGHFIRFPPAIKSLLVIF